jgi:AraC-like DNA-binding protein
VLDVLARALPATGRQQVPGLIDITRDLVIAGVAPSRDTVERARPAVDSGLLGQIDRVIHREIGSPALSPESIFRTFGMSRSALYRVCERRGGVAAMIAMIKQARLVRIHALLSDPGETRRIFEIVHLYGFVSETRFSREFRCSFGYSRREARTMAVAESPESRIAATDAGYAASRARRISGGVASSTSAAIASAVGITLWRSLPSLRTET